MESRAHKFEMNRTSILQMQLGFVEFPCHSNSILSVKPMSKE